MTYPNGIGPNFGSQLFDYSDWLLGMTPQQLQQLQMLQQGMFAPSPQISGPGQTQTQTLGFNPNDQFQSPDGPSDPNNLNDPNNPFNPDDLTNLANQVGDPQLAQYAQMLKQLMMQSELQGDPLKLGNALNNGLCGVPGLSGNNPFGLQGGMDETLIDFLMMLANKAAQTHDENQSVGSLSPASWGSSQPTSWSGAQGGPSSSGGGTSGSSGTTSSGTAPTVPPDPNATANAKAFLDKVRGQMTPAQQKEIDAALSMMGMPYIYGGKAGADNPHPAGLDCSGFANWAVGRAGGQMNLATSTSSGGTPISMEQALHTPGALLIKPGDGPNGHIVISVGDGKHTLEAMGTAYGIRVGNVRSEFTYAVLPNGVPLNQVHG